MKIEVGSSVMVMIQGGGLVLGEVTGIVGDEAYVYLFLFECERVYTISQLQRWNKGA